MTEETLKRLDRYVTKNMKKIGIPVRRHLFMIQCRCGKLIQQPRRTGGETWLALGIL